MSCAVCVVSFALYVACERLDLEVGRGSWQFITSRLVRPSCRAINVLGRSGDLATPGWYDVMPATSSAWLSEGGTGRRGSGRRSERARASRQDDLSIMAGNRGGNSLLEVPGNASGVVSLAGV